MAQPINPRPTLEQLTAELDRRLLSYAETNTDADRVDAFRGAINAGREGLAEQRKLIESQVTLWGSSLLATTEDRQLIAQVAKSISAYEAFAGTLANAEDTLESDSCYEGYLFLRDAQIHETDRIPREEAERRVQEASQQGEFQDKIPFLLTWCPNKTYIILTSWEQRNPRTYRLILEPPSLQWHLDGHQENQRNHFFKKEDVIGSIYRRFAELYSHNGFLAVDPARRPVEKPAAAAQ